MICNETQSIWTEGLDSLLSLVIFTNKKKKPYQQ